MLLVIGLLLPLLSSPPTASTIGNIENSAGTAMLMRGAESVSVPGGTSWQANDILRTGPGGLVRLVLSDGSALLVGENSELRVTEHNPDTEQTTVELLYGSVLSQNKPVTKSGGHFVIRTPTAVVVALGTTLRVQTDGAETAAASQDGPQLVVQSDGQPVAGADVVLVLANLNKAAPLGKTDEQGNTPSAADLANAAAAQGLDLANLGKVEMHAEVDECDDGTRQVYLVGPGGNLPPPRKNCKRKTLSGVFFWRSHQRTILDLARGISETVQLSAPGTPTTPAAGPKSLSDIPTNAETTSSLKLSSYKPVNATVVTCLDHFVLVLNIDANVQGRVYLLPGQGTVVGRGRLPAPPTRTTQLEGWRKLVESYWPGAPVSELGLQPRPLDFDVDGKPCVPALIIDGEQAAGIGGMFHYKISGLGTSTGHALQLTVHNDGRCPVYFLVIDGTILHPKGFTERVVKGLFLGGTPSLKDFQKMISMGAFLRVPGAVAVTSGPAAAPSGGEASTPLRSYCVELHKLAPHPKTEYRFGDQGDQEQFAPERPILDRTFSMVQTGELQVPQGHNMDGMIQWSLWKKLEHMDQKKFKEEYDHIVRTNYEARKKKYDKAAEAETNRSAESLWPTLEKITSY